MTGPRPRRDDALTRERIVEATIAILDGDGDDGLTVRAVTARLATGRGAIYHHVSGKDDLLAAAADAVVDEVLASADREDDPGRAIRGLALGVFAAIDAHPWVGAQLSRDPFQPAVLRLWTSLGIQLERLGVDGADRADAGATLVGYVLGAAAQYAAGARRAGDGAARGAFLDALAAAWTQHAGPHVGEQASLLREHDDREQFLAGVDIVLAGISARWAAEEAGRARAAPRSRTTS